MISPRQSRNICSHSTVIMKRRISSALFAMLVLSPTALLAQFEGMKTRIPTDANTLVLINADKMLSSPKAERETLGGPGQGKLRSGHHRLVS